MKLIPQAKPVRIRISCDRQEHFSLASLRKSFRCNEVAELMGAPLVKWLKQQNESEVADRVKSLIDRKEKCSPVELASAFFTEAGIDKVDSPLLLFDFWWQHGYQYNAIKFVEDCYQTYKTDPDAETLFHKYLHLDDDEKQRDVLFLTHEKDIDNDLARIIPLAITFWIENGYKLEAGTFIRGHQKLFANNPKLREFLLNREELAPILKSQESSTAAATKALTAQGYTIEDLKNIMHDRFNGLSDYERSLCMRMALKAKEGLTLLPIRERSDDERIVNNTHGFFRWVSEIVRSLKDLTYDAKDWTPRTNSYHIYDRCIYNIMRAFFGHRIYTTDETKWYCTVGRGNYREALRAIRRVCDAYMLSEAEFKRRHGAEIPYIHEK